MDDTTVQSFWIGASYLLSMCISQPIASKFSLVFACRSTVLFSTMLVGIGSMLCERAQTMPLMLAGRSVQGLGAGGLTALSYALYARLESLGPGRGMGLVSAIALSNAVGTVCGPVIGAISAGNQDWVTEILKGCAHPLTCAPDLDLSCQHSALPRARGRCVQC